MLKAKQTDRAALPAGPTSLRRRPIVRLPVAMLLAAAASACTLSDSLVPPNPIPEARPSEAAGYGQDATPIDPSTGDDRVAMAAPAPTGPVEAAALPPPAATTSRSGGVYAPRAAPGSGSSNRQAAAFPAASQKRRTPPPARASEPQPAPAAAPAAPAAAATTTASREPARQTAPTIRFTPVIGAPVGAIRPLSAELEKAARRHGVVIRNTADEPVDNILRGYFSASAGGFEGAAGLYVGRPRRLGHAAAPDAGHRHGARLRRGSLEVRAGCDDAGHRAKDDFGLSRMARGAAGMKPHDS